MTSSFDPLEPIFTVLTSKRFHVKRWSEQLSCFAGRLKRPRKCSKSPFSNLVWFKYLASCCLEIYKFSKLHSTITSSLLGVTGRSNYRNEHENKLFHNIKSKISFYKISDLDLRVAESARILLVSMCTKNHFQLKNTITIPLISHITI